MDAVRSTARELVAIPTTSAAIAESDVVGSRQAVGTTSLNPLYTWQPVTGTSSILLVQYVTIVFNRWKVTPASLLASQCVRGFFVLFCFVKISPLSSQLIFTIMKCRMQSPNLQLCNKYHGGSWPSARAWVLIIGNIARPRDFCLSLATTMHQPLATSGSLRQNKIF